MNPGHLAFWIGALALTACTSRDEPSPRDVPPGGATDVLVVQAPSPLADEAAEALAGVLAAYPGGRVVLEAATARADPPADLLVFEGAGAAMRASEEGAVLPLAGTLAAEAVPAGLRDPDGGWLALAWRPLAIVHGPTGDPGAPGARAGAEGVSSYAALADPAYAGHLCLARFDADGYPGLVALLIDSLGERDAELAVRGWLKNLALPPVENTDEVLAALAEGRCAVGIAAPAPGFALDYRIPADAAGQLLAAGVARHSRDPDAAGALLDWLARDAGFRDAARAVPEDGLPARSLAVTGWLEEDARELAERAGYR